MSDAANVDVARMIGSYVNATGVAAVIDIHGEGALGNRGITIRENTFLGSYASDVHVQWEGA